MDPVHFNHATPSPQVRLPVRGSSLNRNSMHRVQTVCNQQSMSHRSAARHLGIHVSEVKQQLRESTDLRLSELYRWQQILDVPISELLVEPEDGLSEPLVCRARLIRLMKSAKAISEVGASKSVTRMAQRMIDQLIEIMPELSEVSAWHTIGQRRGLNEMGRIVDYQLSEDVLRRDRED